MDNTSDSYSLPRLMDTILKQVAPPSSWWTHYTVLGQPFFVQMVFHHGRFETICLPSRSYLNQTPSIAPWQPISLLPGEMPPISSSRFSRIMHYVGKSPDFLPSKIAQSLASVYGRSVPSRPSTQTIPIRLLYPTPITYTEWNDGEVPVRSGIRNRDYRATLAKGKQRN